MANENDNKIVYLKFIFFLILSLKINNRYKFKNKKIELNAGLGTLNPKKFLKISQILLSISISKLKYIKLKKLKKANDKTQKINDIFFELKNFSKNLNMKKNKKNLSIIFDKISE